MEMNILLGARLVPKSKVDPVFLELFREPVFQFSTTHASQMVMLETYQKINPNKPLLPFPTTDFQHGGPLGQEKSETKREGR